VSAFKKKTFCAAPFGAINFILSICLIIIASLCATLATESGRQNVFRKVCVELQSQSDGMKTYEGSNKFMCSDMCPCPY
jgi:hypothetical protein